jgi:hypothetical protein
MQGKPGPLSQKGNNEAPGAESTPQTPGGSANWFRIMDYTGILVRILPKNDPDLFYADQALRNTIYVYSSLEPYSYESEIDWAVGDKTDTWYHYFQSLEILGYLANAAEVSGEARYIEKAASILESWFDFQNTSQLTPARTYVDAAVANRVRNVTHFLRAWKTLSVIDFPDTLFRKIFVQIEKHAAWMLENKNYHPNNHGMMTSIALVQTALVFPDYPGSRQWLDVGMERIRERIKADLSKEGVHLEHSAFYHVFFLELVLSIEQFLKIKGISLFDPGVNIVEDMKRHVAYLVMPNGKLPLLGDTSMQKVVKTYDHPWITYSLSRGRKGTRPPNTSKVYPDAGLAVLRDKWNRGNTFLDTTYLVFQSGFHSRAHKHADDLGFILYSHGEDIFTGPGVYAYDTSNYRQYMKSTMAHNSLTVDGKNYPIIKDNVGKARITGYKLADKFDFVQGRHTMYKKVSLKRSLILIRPSTIMIIDEVLSDKEHSIQQIFNLAPGARDLEFDRDRVVFKVGNKGVKVELRQMCETRCCNHYYGDEKILRGFISPLQRKLAPVHQLEFENIGIGVVFITQIIVTGPDEDGSKLDSEMSSKFIVSGV